MPKLTIKIDYTDNGSWYATGKHGLVFAHTFSELCLEINNVMHAMANELGIEGTPDEKVKALIKKIDDGSNAA